MYTKSKQKKKEISLQIRLYILYEKCGISAQAETINSINFLLVLFCSFFVVLMFHSDGETSSCPYPFHSFTPPHKTESFLNAFL